MKRFIGAEGYPESKPLPNSYEKDIKENSKQLQQVLLMVQQMTNSGLFTTDEDDTGNPYLKFNEEMLYQKLIDFQTNVNNPNVTNRSVLEYRAKLVKDELSSLKKQRKRLQGNILDKEGYINIMNLKQEANQRSGLLSKLFNKQDPALEEATKIELKRIEEDIKEIQEEVEEITEVIEKMEKDVLALETALSNDTNQKLN